MFLPPTMRAIVLAAGMGTRLSSHTEEKPKCLVELVGKPLLARQLEVLRTVADDIVIVRGYLASAIEFPDVRYYENPDYRSTGIVASLMCARDELAGDCLVCYSDIVYEPCVARAIAQCRASIGVVVDTDYQDYWHARLDADDSLQAFYEDQESLRLGGDGQIVELGAPDPSEEEIDGRYVGLIRFGEDGAQVFKRTYDELSDRYDKPNKAWRHSYSFWQASMTDMLQALIDQGQRVDSVPIQHGWLEMDTVKDYDRYHQWIKGGSMGRFYRGL